MLRLGRGRGLAEGREGKACAGLTLSYILCGSSQLSRIGTLPVDPSSHMITHSQEIHARMNGNPGAYQAVSTSPFSHLVKLKAVAQPGAEAKDPIASTIECGLLGR